jgi:hypothetical protein
MSGKSWAGKPAERRVGARLSRRLTCRYASRESHLSVTAQADALYVYALLTAPKTSASAASRMDVVAKRYSAIGLRDEATLRRRPG